MKRYEPAKSFKERQELLGMVLVVLGVALAYKNLLRTLRNLLRAQRDPFGVSEETLASLLRFS